MALRAGLAGGAAVLSALSLCGCRGAELPAYEEGRAVAAEPPAILATNAFYYYDDLERAWDFYARILGLRTVADFGFAKILQAAPASFLTLVDGEHGMRSTTLPKTVTLAFVTQEVEGWWAYLQEEGLEMRAPLRTGEDGEVRPHDGFVARDPEGYLLEFERFNPHPENERLLPLLEGVRPLRPDGRETAPGILPLRPPELGIQATVLWLYYPDLEPVQRFYEGVLGVELAVDQGWAKVYPASPTGFIGLVDGARGLHAATDEKAVTVSFFTRDLEGWLRHLTALEVPLRTPGVAEESGRVRVLVAYDPQGYFLEWDAFLEVEGNEELLRLLGGGG